MAAQAQQPKSAASNSKKAQKENRSIEKAERLRAMDELDKKIATYKKTLKVIVISEAIILSKQPLLRAAACSDS